MAENLVFGLEVTFTGLVVVFTALIAVALIVTLFQRIDRPQKEIPAAPPAPARPAPAPVRSASTTNGAAASNTDGKMSPELAAVIAAAATLAVGKKVRIQQIRYRSGPVETAWATQGRHAIMASHQRGH